MSVVELFAADLFLAEGTVRSVVELAGANTDSLGPSLLPPTLD